MNIREKTILLQLLRAPRASQRTLARHCNCSLGIVNRSIRNLIVAGMIDKHSNITEAGNALLSQGKPKQAIILAAGYGVRMVPINTEVPKGLLEVKGEVLVERLITQLHQQGINDITIVVGFLKEQYEYLIDQYGVRLVVNMGYATKNNLHSLASVSKYLSDSYIIPCDVWCKENPFNIHELYSWYMVTDENSEESSVRINRKGELVPAEGKGNMMIGIAYLREEDAAPLRSKLKDMSADDKHADAFWEEALFSITSLRVSARVVPSSDVIEINTYENLREIDRRSSSLNTDAITMISSVFNISERQITDITLMKKGMTNRSFLFTCNGERFIMRIPGEGTARLINRRQEALVYTMLEGLGICDDVIHMDPSNGYKITKFLPHARVCDPTDLKDVSRCMTRLREFHGIGLSVAHEFDIYDQLEFYETLWDGRPSLYKDYHRTKENIYALRPFIESQAHERVLCHIDAVPDNFLILGEQAPIRLIDWEYAGMQDPHVDIAMFAIYSFYDKEQIDALIDAYFPEGVNSMIRIKIYAYVATCGLLWSNWAEYKRTLGVEFGEYSLRQYRYAKDYHRLVSEFLAKG